MCEPIDGRGEKFPLEGGRGSEDRHLARCRAFGGGFDGRLHPHKGSGGETRSKRAQGGRGGGVAGQNDEPTILVEQEARDPFGEHADLACRAGSVGHMLLVGKVDERFVWESTPDLAQDREPPDTGIKNADRGLVHTSGSLGYLGMRGLMEG